MSHSRIVRSSSIICSPDKTAKSNGRRKRSGRKRCDLGWQGCRAGCHHPGVAGTRWAVLLDLAAGPIEANACRTTSRILVKNTGDRPIQVGSHYHFFETNVALWFERERAFGMRLNIAAGTAVRFEPGQSREVSLIPYGGARLVYGFNQAVMGALPKVPAS